MWRLFFLSFCLFCFESFVFPFKHLSSQLYSSACADDIFHPTQRVQKTKKAFYSSNLSFWCLSPEAVVLWWLLWGDLLVTDNQIHTTQVHRLFWSEKKHLRTSFSLTCLYEIKIFKKPNSNIYPPPQSLPFQFKINIRENSLMLKQSVWILYF